MPTCKYCGAEREPSELIRHERPGVLLVHCPECQRLLGRYRRHGDDPDTDTLEH
ncbi:hypothetical protein [Halegenticoccus soli]|uniref:hypothetical protein n=1 Tax=Halegenticoccus soli TaxID=1985678 RepID=UPI0018EA80C0|nr:hypothetical protein [Halegenticoccus soli]